jgi:hypothetical protein
MLLTSATTAQGALVVQALDSSTNPGSAGAFDVVLQNTGTSDTLIGAFFVEVTTSSPYVTFTGADQSTSAPYIFTGFDADGVYFGSFAASTTDMTVYDSASDTEGNPIDVTVAAGATVGLAHIYYSLDPNTPLGALQDTVMFSSDGTSLAAWTTGGVTIDGFVPGTITAIPEPSMLAIFTGLGLTCTGWFGLAGFRRRHRSVATGE